MDCTYLFEFLENRTVTTTERRDFNLITRKNSNEMIQQSQRQISHTSSIHHDFNSLLNSMSSSTSSIQNSRVRKNKRIIL